MGRPCAACMRRCGSPGALLRLFKRLQTNRAGGSAMPMSIDRRRLLGGSAAIGLVGAFPRRLRAQEPRTKIRVGLVRLISSGPIFVAEAKNFFEKVNLDVELKYFADGALAMPALVAGELDLTASTLNAGLFNAVAKGAPYKLILDRGIEKPGSGSMTIVARMRCTRPVTPQPTKPSCSKARRLPSRHPAVSTSICSDAPQKKQALTRRRISIGRAECLIRT